MSSQDDLFKLVGIFVAVVIMGAFATTDWSAVLTGNQSQVIVEVPENPPAPPEMPPAEDPGDLPPVVEPILNLDFNVSSVDWGSLSPGGSVSKGVLLTNIGNVGCQVFLKTQNWVPGNASDWIFLSWDHEGCTLGIGESVEALLTLNVDPGIQGITDFSFDVVFSIVEN